MYRGNISETHYQQVKNILKTSYSISNFKTLVTAEWNYNRYTKGVTATEYPTTTPVYDDILFPISSIIEPRRPVKDGIIKAEIGMKIKRDIASVPLEQRQVGKVYPVDETDYYKFWKSSKKSAGSTTNGVASISPINLEVNYGAAGVATNKIKIIAESSYVGPAVYTIEATINGQKKVLADNTVATLGRDGIIQIYLQNDGSWSPTKNINNAVNIQKVSIVVTGLNRASSRLSIIEMSARLVRDLSSRVVEGGVKIDEELSNSNAVAPLGEATSNVASVTLSNTDQLFNNQNVSSPYYGLVDKNVEFKIYSVLDRVEILMATMHSQSWNNQETEEVQVELEDSSSFLKNINVPRMYLESKKVGQIIIYILNRLGFTNYDFGAVNRDVTQVIPYFWTDGEKTAWEIISDLAKTTQTSVVIDEFDEIHIRAREQVYRKVNIPDWEFSSRRNGPELADIESYSKDSEYEANLVTANYKPTDVSSFNNGFPKMETVWEESDTILLRSRPLTLELSSTDRMFRISGNDAMTWPYKGLVNINGEYIEFDAKEYRYYKSSTPSYKLISSIEEKEALDAESSEFYKFRNSFTGKIKIESSKFINNVPSGRGKFGSPITTQHSSMNIGQIKTSLDNISLDGRNFDKIHHYSTSTTNASINRNFTGYSAANSVLKIKGMPGWGLTHQLMFRSKTQITSNRYSTGTRLKFNNTVPTTFNEAGVMIKQGVDSADRAGCLFVTLVPTESTQKGFKGFRSEVNIWERSLGGNKLLVAKGSMSVIRNVWYDLDVKVETRSDGLSVTAFVNGKRMAHYAAPNTFLNRGRFNGVMIGGYTEAEFEYFYIDDETEKPGIEADTSSFFDRVKGDFSSGVIDRDYLGGRKYGIRKYAKDVFTDFGSNVHEVRDIEVKFENGPVQHSRVYVSNEKVICSDYTADAFGAKFTLINVSHFNEVANGEDKQTYGANNPVSQKVLIYGRLINQEDSETVEAKDEDSIKVRSEVSTAFESEFIQTKSFADQLVDWTKEMWAKGSIESTLKVFGNPLIKINDVVSIHYPEKQMYRTERHLVVGIQNAFDKGLETILTVRSIPN